MNSFHFIKTTAILLLAALLLIHLTGCDGRPRRVPVTGTVLVDGKPLEGEIQGYVRFMPTAGGRSAQAALDKNGNFVLGNYEETDGCPLGEYKVEIQAFEVNGNRMRYLIPPRYGNPKTSGITVKIDKKGQAVQLKTEWTAKDSPWRKKSHVME
ncbi:MAG: hypothetical protein Q4C70_09315 [Planctomycetia bacterium]|nr:hypothetical protein [Planctomycetia bacterium]